MNLVQTKIWTVYEVDMKHEHLKREQVLHNYKTEITPNPKIPKSSVAHHGTDEFKPAPTPSVAEIRQT